MLKYKGFHILHNIYKKFLKNRLTLYKMYVINKTYLLKMI